MVIDGVRNFQIPTSINVWNKNKKTLIKSIRCVIFTCKKYGIMPEKIFNIRVYVLLINNKNEILVVQEMVKARIITKFPGGGLEFGEGLLDCLIREFKEELNIAIEVKSHFYTTDFFVESFFNPDHQVISVYYFVQTDTLLEKKYTTALKDELAKGELYFSWIPVKQLNADVFNLPIDKHVAEMLNELFQKGN